MYCLTRLYKFLLFLEIGTSINTLYKQKLIYWLIKLRINVRYALKINENKYFYFKSQYLEFKFLVKKRFSDHTPSLGNFQYYF